MLAYPNQKKIYLAKHALTRSKEWVNDLRWDKTTIEQDHICNQKKRKKSKVICSYESICKGDSGGPAVCSDGKGKPVLQGISSYKESHDCIKGKYGFFTKVSKYLQP